MRDLERAVAATGFVKEAEAFLKIAQILDGRSKEEACAIMGAVASALGFYELAKGFSDLALQYRAFDAAAFEQEA